MLVAGAMRYRGDAFGTANHWAVQFWGALAAGAFCVFAAFRLKRHTAFGVIVLFLTLVLIEAVLQVLGWSGALPGPFTTKPRSPYARVYYAWEGKGNSVRNRYGWHAPEFQLNAPRRIVLVGDSFVEALEVNRTKTTGAILQDLLRKSGRGDAVLPLGVFGTSPAQYFATIEYARKHFQPDEIVVFVFVGNDVSDSSPRLNKIPAGHFFYYQPDAMGGMKLSPEDAGTHDRFLRGLEFSHEPAHVTLATTFSSHCMILQTALTAKDMLNGLRRRAPALPQAGNDRVGAQVEALGLNPKVFETPTPSDVEDGIARLLLTLRGIQAYCGEHKMAMRVVALPFFPPALYEQQKGTGWTMQLGKYDFETPQRRLAEESQAMGIAFLDLTQSLRTMDVAAIQGLFFVNGSGHFTERGHQVCAQAVFNQFYAQPR
jgi:hypothetical protein